MILHWRGPTRLTNKVFSSLQQVETKIAVIAGPAGRQGDPGAPGPKGEKGDAAVLDESALQLILDGGNF